MNHPVPRRFLVALLTLLALTPAHAALIQSNDRPADSLPDSFTGRCVRAFFDMLSDPTPDRIKAFETEYRSPKRLAELKMEERINRARDVRDRMGKLTLREVLSADDNAVSVAADSDNGNTVSLTFAFDPQNAGKLDGITISSGATPAARPEKLTTDLRAKTVEDVAAAVVENYVYPDVGRKMADLVLEKLKSGAYDSIETDSQLSLRLTDDLRSINNDRHLGVRAQPRDAARRHDGPSTDDIAGSNSAFRKVEILPGNIGYVRLDAFVESPEAQDTAAAALAFLAHADALIFDLRRNGGGSPEMIRFISSYLFDQRTHLNDMIDRNGKVVEEFWTLDKVPGERFAPDLPVFVLTSSYTFSGAEEFCYNLQNLKRATIVGETTGGGAHPVMGVRLNDRIVVGVPFMRACNPISKKNWEGTGVQPDVTTSADEALDRAAELAKSAIAARRAPSGPSKK